MPVEGQLIPRANDGPHPGHTPWNEKHQQQSAPTKTNNALPEKPSVVKATKPAKRMGMLETIQHAKEQAHEQAELRASRPQPWIALKFTIAIAVAILGYCTYVYIGRLCIPMLRREPEAMGGFVMGAVFIAIFLALLLMVIWTYIKVLATPPGRAPDYIPKSARPLMSPTPRSVESHDEDTQIGTAYDQMVPMDSAYAERQSNGPSSFTADRRQNSDAGTSHRGPSQSDKPPTSRRPSHARSSSHVVERRLSRSHSQTRMERRPSRATSHRRPSVSSQIAPSVSSHPRRPSSLDRHTSETAGVLDALPPVAAVKAKLEPHPSAPNGVAPAHNSPSILPISRRPIGTPVLLPAQRWCTRCEIVKPKRTHHCRACGTCVLKYDHHCPWIGQCVGARNHKFFVNFLEWTTLFCIWLLATVIGRVAQRGSSEIDPQHIVLIAFSGLFTFFAGSLLVSHIHLLTINSTTVESIGFQSMKEREAAVLGGARGASWYQCAIKSRTRNAWNEEWGRIGTEGNLWWLGSKMMNWKTVMGEKWYMWILPVGRSESDGLDYPTNPRFDAEGRWMQRKDWPKELR